MRKDKKVFALGFFDGVHLGHQALLRECCALAGRLDCQTAAITFGAHPQSLFTQNPPPLINTADDREALLRQYRIGAIYRLPVTKEVMSTPWQDFLAQLLEYGAEGFVVGDDFRFGHKGEGDAQKLKAFCQERAMPCIVIPEQTVDGIRVSSSHIRTLIEDGEMEQAVRFLGHPHILTGTVVSGRKLGRTIGVPTANLLLPEGVIVPKFGVYACRCNIGGRDYAAVTNIGSRPTVGGHQVRAESWILDFEGDLYGQNITLEFYQFLREERKFPNLGDLQAEVLKNGREVRNFFGKN